MTFPESVNRLLAGKNRDERFSGVVLIQRDGDVLFEAAHGYANRSWKVKNQVDTRFRIGSSKMITAVAVLQLVDEGKLSLDARVVECLGLEDTAIPREATVYHMLTMTSGIADWLEESEDWDEQWAALSREHPIYLLRRNEDYLPLFVHKDPVRPVGEKHQYSNASYILLGLVIEKLSGLSYFDCVRQRVFARAQMSRSDFLALDGVYDEVAEGYIPIKDDRENVIDWRRNIYSVTPEAAADGGATSTAPDLIRFARALRKGELLSAEMTQEMQTPKVLESDDGFRGYTWKYGYGNTFILDEDGRIVRWGHTGEEDGISARLYHYPERNLDVAICANQSWCAGGVGWEIHDLIPEMTP